MAKKKTTVIEEETPEATPEVEATLEHNKAVLEALTVDPNAPLEIDPTKLDEPATEEVKVEEPKVEPPIDKEAIKAELKEEVTKDIQAKIVEQLQGTKEEKKDAYADFEKEIWDKEGRTPTYKEALDLIKVQAKEEIKAELNAEVEAEQKQEQDTQKAQETQQQELNDSLNKDWDEQLGELVKAGRIPGIKDASDDRVQVVSDASGKEIERIPLEEGKRARYELFKAMYLASEERINTGAKPLTNLKEIYYEHYSKDKQPAGANAPIAGVRKSVSQDSGTSFKYSDIHNTPFEDLLKQAS